MSRACPEEALGDIEGDSKDSVLNTALLQLEYQGGQDSGTAVEFAIDPAKFHLAFAADLPERTGRRHGRYPAPGRRRRIHRTQRGAGLEEPASVDRHVIMISQPRAVTDVILQAIDGVTH